MIVESPTKAKKIAPLPRQATTSSSRRSATSATFRAVPPTSRPSTRASRGRASAWTSTTSSQPLYIVTPEKKGKVSELQRRAEERRRAAARHGPRPRGRGHRLAPARHAQAQGARPADGVPRDHRARHPRGRRRTCATSTTTSSTRRRPAASSTASTATRSPRCCGRRSCRGCRRAGCSRWPRGSSCSASASGWRSSPRGYWDIAADAGRGRRGRRRGSSRRGSSPSTATASPRAATSARTAQLKRRSAARARRGAARAGSPRPSTAATWPSSRSSRKPYTRKPYAPFMTSTLQQEAGPQAALLGRAHDARRPAAVRERLHHLHAYRLDHAVRVGHRRRPRAGPRALRRRLRLRRSRGSTPARSRTRRRPTRPSGPSGETFRTPGAGGRASSTATTSGSTS